MRERSACTAGAFASAAETRVGIDLDPRAVGPQENQIGFGAGQQDGLREYVHEGADHRERGRDGHLICRQPLAHVAVRGQAGSRQLVELPRIERAYSRVRDRWWLEGDQVVRALGLHQQMLPAVVDVDRQLRVAQHPLISVLEVVGVVQDAARQIGKVDALDRRVERCGVCRVADAKADDQNGPWVAHRQQRHVGERAHVALRERPGRRHRMTVGAEREPLAWHFGHRDHLGEAVADRQHRFAFRRSERTGDHMVGRELHPQHEGTGADDERSTESPRGDSGLGRDSGLGIRGLEFRARGSSGQIERHDGKQRDGHQDRRAELKPEHGEQNETRHEAADERAGCVGQIQHASTTADETLGALNHGVGERKAEAHEQGGHGNLGEHRGRVEPELRPGAGHASGGLNLRTAQSAHRLVDGPDVRDRESKKGRDDERRLRDHEPHSRHAGSAAGRASRQRSDADPHENHGEQQGKHSTKSAKENREVPEPQNLHPHGRDTGQREGDAREDHGPSALGVDPARGIGASVWRVVLARARLRGARRASRTAYVVGLRGTRPTRAGLRRSLTGHDGPP